MRREQEDIEAGWEFPNLENLKGKADPSANRREGAGPIKTAKKAAEAVGMSERQYQRDELEAACQSDKLDLTYGFRKFVR